MRQLGTVALLVMSTLLLSAIAPALAQDETGDTSTKVDVRLELSTREELSDLIAGRLTTEAEPVGNAELSFWFTTEEFGGRSVLIGRAFTDATGWARIPVDPRRAEYDLIVRFKGNQELAPAEGTATLRFPDEAVHAFAPQEDGGSLSALRTALPRVIGILVGLLWAGLIYLGLSTVAGVKRGAPELAGAGSAQAIDQASNNPSAERTNGASRRGRRRNRKGERAEHDDF